MDLCKEDEVILNARSRADGKGFYIRSARTGGLAEEAIIARQLHEEYAKSVGADNSAANPEAEVKERLLKTRRENEYKAPMHRARTTRAYSVSFPV
jgi:hypothetical protein